jgi:hypothetical protein
MAATPYPITALQSWHKVVRWGVLSAIALMLMMGAGLLARRLGGAFIQPLDEVSLVATALLLAIGSLCIRILWNTLLREWSGAAELWFVFVVPSLAVLCFAFAVSLPDVSTRGFWAFWAILAIAEATGMWLVWRCVATSQRESREEPGPQTTTGEAAPSTRHPLDDPDRRLRFDAPHQPSPLALPRNVSQQLTRASDEQGVDVLFGVLRGTFAPDQRAIRLHVSFCPPFETMPDISIEQTDGPEVRITVGQIQTFGARIEARLTSVFQESQDVLLEIFAREREQL